MIISHDYKLIFMHMQKTGGTSILSSLGISNKHKFPYKGRNYEGFKKIKTIHHETTRSSKQKIYESGNQEYINIWNSYTKFSVRRNPWDIAVSDYFHAKRHKTNRFYHSFHRTPIFNKKVIECQPQYVSWFLDEEGNPLLDFVINFETLKKDYMSLLDRLGLSYDDHPLQHKLKSKRKHYREYYNEELKNMVAEKQKDYIELFSYEF